MVIRKIEMDEIQQALALILTGFNTYVAPDYTLEGVETFYELLHDPQTIGLAEYWGAFEGEKILGVIASRRQRSHICFFFVDGEPQNRKIGRALFTYFLRETDCRVVTVNSSPYAEPIYHSMGFQDMGPRRISDGIIFTPMEYRKA